MARISLNNAINVMPMLSDIVAEEIAKVDYIVSKFIIRGFDATVQDKVYHFSFDETDQANFTQELIRANTAAQTGHIEDYRASWRGHVLESNETVTLTLNMAEFTSLAMTGGTWKGKVLEKGWAIKDALAKCTTEAEVTALNNKYKIDETYLLARDNQPFVLDLTQTDTPPAPSVPEGSTPGVPEGVAPEGTKPPKIRLAVPEVTGAVGSRHPLDMTFDFEGVEEKTRTKIQYHLHMWARNCVLHGFGDHPPYGQYKPEEPSYGEGYGIEGNLNAIAKAIENLEVEVTQDYGIIDISLYPVAGAGLETAMFFIRNDDLPARKDFEARVKKYNDAIPAMPPEVAEERRKASERYAKAVAQAKGEGLEEGSKEFYDRVDAIVQELAQAEPGYDPNAANKPYADEEGIPYNYWDMMFVFEPNNMLKADIARFEKYITLIKERYEAYQSGATVLPS